MIKSLRHSIARGRLLVAVLVCVCPGLVGRVQAYIDLAPTLSKIVQDSQRISVVEVASFDQSTHVLTLKETKALKGTLGTALIRQDLAEANSGVVPPEIVQWAEAGARGVLFSSRTTSLVCFGQGWYQAKSSGGQWKLGVDRADLPLAYYGTVSRLADGIATMLAGGTAIMTTVQHGADDAASFDLALNRARLPSVIRVQRIRASMSMPGTVAAVSANPAYLVGPGLVGQEDVPALLKRLSSPTATARAEAAEDLQQLGRKAASAGAPLVKLLADPVIRVRLSAASAVLSIGGTQDEALDVLAKGLSSTDAATQRAAAEAVGRAGQTAGPVVSGLVALLKGQTNASVRHAAVRAVGALGPAGSDAATALVPLLDDATLMIEVADALGRIGPAARPVPKRLVSMLADDQPLTVRNAALRAMAQIGGQEAHPAVDYIIKTLPTADEIGMYNMHIYLSLLGPVATDAIPALQSARLMNPVLPTATLWAIRSNSLPWQAMAGGRGGFPFGAPPGGAGFGGGPGGGLGFDLFSTMYLAYFRELGARLQPVALMLLQDIQNGTANDTPLWGYKLLTCAPTESVTQLSAALESGDLNTRERATVALGYMGAASFPAQAKLQTALSKASTDGEKKLIEWALREGVSQD
jgi:HEAT repeat protein